MTAFAPQGTLINYKDRETWLASRTNGIGASEVAILFGMAPKSWGSIYSLWMEKTGKVKPTELEGEWLEWGQLLEPAIAARYEQVTKRKLWDGGNAFCVAQHQRLPMLRCTPDRWVVEADDKPVPGLLQLKNVGWYMASDWDDGVPEHIQIQEQCEMAVTGAPWADVAGLIGGNRFARFEVLRNDAFIAELEAQVEWFWDLVVRDVPPPIDGSDATSEALKKLHPLDDGSIVTLPAEALGWFEDAEEAKATMKEAEEIKDRCQNLLRASIGASTFGVLPDGRVLSYKHSTSNHKAKEAYVSTSRTLRQLSDAAAKKVTG